jgi:hypothetical protein
MANVDQVSRRQAIATHSEQTEGYDVCSEARDR